MPTEELNKRHWELLKRLIEHYICDGVPVASKTLVDDLHLSVSSATVRHIMSNLERQGYVVSPHTSAGRVPTEQGYRLFVDDLLTSEPLLKTRVKELHQSLNPSHSTQDLLRNTSAILSDVTKLAGLVTVPKRNKVILKHIEFLPLSMKRVLIILVFNDSEVQNRVISTCQEYSKSELQQAANYLNEKYAGCEFTQIRDQLVSSMQKDRDDMDSLMNLALSLGGQAFGDEKEQEDYVFSGETNLLNGAEFCDLGRLKSLFGAFTQKQAILHLLDQCLKSDGTRIFIGKEAGHEVFEDYSIVAAPYEVDGEVLGVLGVIGPIRMPYSQVISTVNVTAKMLGDALKK